MNKILTRFIYAQFKVMFRNLQECFFNAIINLHYQVLPSNFESFIYFNLKVKQGERVCVIAMEGVVSLSEYPQYETE